MIPLLPGLRVLDLSRDLSSPAGRTVLERLLDGADVRIENFLPGTMEKWGLGYEATLAASAPDFVAAEISETEMIALNYTSGTTANPKGVMVSHRPRRARFWPNVGSPLEGGSWLRRPGA